MDIFVKDSGGSKFPPLPAGSYSAMCYGIVGLGTTFNPTFGNHQTKVMFMWELPEERVEIDGESVPRTITETYTMSLNEKGNLRKMLEGWRGVPFSPEELKGFGLSKVLGKPCLVSTILKAKQNGDEFAKISSITRLPKGMPVPTRCENDIILWDIANPECSLAEMAKLPEWVQKRIHESDEYRARGTGSDDFSVITEDEDLPF